jgi:hypothetical protein
MEIIEEPALERRVNHIFEGPFELPIVNEAISFLNNNSESVNLFINTPGGYTSYIHPLSRAIQEYGDIILFPIEECSSAGFFLLLKTTAPICLMDKTIRCLIHFPRIETLLDVNKNHIYNKIDFENNQKQTGFKDCLKDLPIPIKQMKKLMKGEDVILYYDDLLEIFKDRIIHE